MTEPRGTTRTISLGWAAGTVGSSTMLGAMSVMVLFFMTEYLGIGAALAPLVGAALAFISYGSLFVVSACFAIAAFVTWCL